MTMRIVLDYLRRHWSMYVVAAFPVSVFWIGAAEAVPLSRQLIVAVTLIVAGVIGPAMAAVRFPQREVRLLPVSRRDLWLARWLVSVVVPTLWTLVPMLAGCWLATLRLRFGPVGRDTLILAPICVFLYLGVLMAAHGLIDIGREPGGRSRPGATWRAYRLGLGAMPAAGLLGAFVFKDYLPVTSESLTPMSLSALVVAALLTLAGALHRPGPGEFTGLEQPMWQASATARWGMFDDPLTGLPKLFLWTSRTLALPVFLAIASMTVVSGLAEYAWPGWGLGWDEILPFSRAADGMPSMLILMVILLAGQDGDMVGQTHVLAGMARHLRTLPVGALAVTSFLIFRRAVGWLALWVGSIATYSLVVGRPELLRLDWLIFIIGIDAVADAVRVRLGVRGQFAAMMVLVAAFAVATLVVQGLAGDAMLASVAQVLIGTAGLAAGISVHHWSVRSGSSLYASDGSDGLSAASVPGQ